MQFSSIWPIDPPGATTAGQSGPGSNVHEGVLRIPQSSTCWGGVYSSTEKQSVLQPQPTGQE